MAAATVAAGPYRTIRPGTDTLTRSASLKAHNTSESGATILGKPVALPVEEVLVVSDRDNSLVPRVHVVGVPVGEIGIQRSRPRQIARQFGGAYRDGMACRLAVVVAF